MLSVEVKDRLNVGHGVVRFFRMYQAPWLDFLSQQGVAISCYYFCHRCWLSGGWLMLLSIVFSRLKIPLRLKATVSVLQ